MTPEKRRLGQTGADSSRVLESSTMSPVRDRRHLLTVALWKADNRHMEAATSVAALRARHPLFLLLAAALAVGCGSRASRALPRVVVDYPNSTFFKTCETYTTAGALSRECQPAARLVVRPTSITLSEDGDGYLSNLDWSSWTDASGVGSGLMAVRCFGGSTDPQCYPGRFSYEVPVRVRLSAPVTTKRGMVFTVVTPTRSGGRSTAVCLPPAGAC